MKRIYFVCLFQCLATTCSLSQSNPVPLISASQTDLRAQARILDRYGELPLSFEANHGQTDGRVKFLSRTGGYTLLLTGDEAVVVLRGKKADTDKAKNANTAHTLESGMVESKAGAVLRMKLRDANPAAEVTGVDELAGTSNYLIGNDPAKWRKNVPTYAKVKYEGIYSGIDLVYYGNQRQLEYDFIVAPGVNPRRILFDVRGAKRIRQDEHGDLILKMGADEIRWHKPVAYQEKEGARELVGVRYAITDKNRVGFEVAEYDSGRPLYIDPVIYSTYLGGSLQDGGSSIALDSAGNAYITGSTQSTDFPTKNPLQPAHGGGFFDAFVAKLNPAGSALVYSTYLGGSGNDFGDGIAVDSAGNACVVGITSSTDFPTKNPLQAANAGGPHDAFVAKLNPAGSALVYSTYLGGGGDDGGDRIAVDSVGHAYISGITSSTDFPTKNPLQPANGGGYDVFVAKINAAGSALVYSTYLGGGGDDTFSAIAVDSVGHAYVTGYTQSTDFPTKNPLQPAHGGGQYDAFVSKINTAGSALVYSTYLGGSGNDFGDGIAVDSVGNTYVTGTTRSTNFPPTPGAFQTVCNQGRLCDNYGDAFVSKLNPAGTALVYSTYLGGNRAEFGGGIAVDSAGRAYVTGSTRSGNFPLVSPSQKQYGHSQDALVSELNSTGSGLIFSSYLGGGGQDGGTSIAVGSSGNAYVTGQTSCNFPTVNPLQAVCGAGNGDAFVAKIDVRPAPTITLSSSLNPSTYGQAVTFIAAATSSLGAPPDGEALTFMKGTTTLGTGALSSGSARFTTSALSATTHTIKAVYGGDSNLLGSRSKAVIQVVNKAPTTTALASSQNPSNAGQFVTFTASVAPQFSGTVTGPVTFYDGTTALKTVP